MKPIRNYYEDSQNKAKIRSIYNSSTNLDAKYEVMKKYGVVNESFEDWLLIHIDFKGNERVLDIGTGNGRFSVPTGRMLKNKGGFIVCCDLTEGIMTSADNQSKQDALPMLHMLADAESLPFLTNEFDVVMANHMLYHLSDLQKGLSEIRRVLKDTGQFLATTNSNQGMPEFFLLHLETMRRLDIPYEVKGPEPVLQYYMATQLFQGPYHDEEISKITREAIAQTFLTLTKEKIEAAGGELLISKPVAALICKK